MAYPPDFDESVDLVLCGFRESERNVLIKRYRDNMSLRNIGIELGLTRERIRQINVAALKKLKLRANKEVILNGIRGNNALSQDDEQPFGNLRISTRARNCLTRAGCSSVDDVAELVDSGALSSISCCGAITEKEIISAINLMREGRS